MPRKGSGVSAGAAWRLAGDASRAEALAELLALRLAAHAYCETHTESAADPANCPFCADRSAYAAWLKSGGEDFRKLGEGRAIPLEKIEET